MFGTGEEGTEAIALEFSIRTGFVPALKKGRIAGAYSGISAAAMDYESDCKGSQSQSQCGRKRSSAEGWTA